MTIRVMVMLVALGALYLLLFLGLCVLLYILAYGLALWCVQQDTDRAERELEQRFDRDLDGWIAELGVED